MILAFRAADRCFENVLQVSALTMLAMLSKETGVMVLPMVIIYHIICKQDSFTFLSREKDKARTVLKYVLMTTTLVFLRISLNCSPPIFSPQDNPASFAHRGLTRYLSYLYLAVFNMLQLLCPSTLSYDWQLGSIPLVYTPLDTRNILSAILAILTSAILVVSRRALYKKPMVFCLLFLVLPYLPASNIFFPVGFVVAERTLYTSCLGYSLLVTIGYQKKSRAVNKRVAWKCLTVSMLVLVLVVNSAKLAHRNTVWSSRESLFRSGLSSTITNGKVFYNYGNYLRDQERKEEAKICYKEALRLWPSYVIALNNLATVSDNETDIETFLLKALHLDPGHTTALFNLGDLYRQQHRCAESQFYFSLCISYNDCLQEANTLIDQCSQLHTVTHTHRTITTQSQHLAEMDKLDQVDNNCGNTSKIN